MGERDAGVIAKISSRHFRKKNGLCLAEGLRCCQEAVTRKNGLLKAVFCTEAFYSSQDWTTFQNAAAQANARVRVLSGADFAKIAETETPQGVVVVMSVPGQTAPKAPGKPFTLLLDQVADPGNLGTILRTAWAVGLDSCWLVKGSADPFSPKAVRAGMGAQFALDVFSFDSLEQAVDSGKALGSTEVWCTMPASGISIFDPAFEIAGSILVIGNEANGISNPKVGRHVTIPMPGCAESLNAAQAATVFLVESLRTPSERLRSSVPQR